MSVFTEDDLNEINIIIANNDVMKLIEFMENNEYYQSHGEDFQNVLIRCGASINLIKQLMDIIGYVNYDKIVSYAISYHHFKLVDYLVSEYYGDFNVLLENDIVDMKDKKIIKYILSKNVRITPAIINRFLLNNSIEDINYFFYLYFYDVKFILSMLSIYKGKTPFTTEKLQKYIYHKKNENKVLISSLYKSIINKRLYRKLNVLFQYDDRDSTSVLNDLYHEISQYSYYAKKELLFHLREKHFSLEINNNILNKFECLSLEKIRYFI